LLFLQHQFDLPRLLRGIHGGRSSVQPKQKGGEQQGMQADRYQAGETDA